MFCPSDVNTGLIQLVGPISSPDLTTITVHRAPLMISVGPRSTAPSMIGNRIDESTQNTCTYNHSKFTLADVQIVSPVHTGYNLPGNTDTPQAELILSFTPNSAPSSLSNLSGLLMCLPIYVSNSASHDSYLDMIIQNDSTASVIPTLESLFYSSSNEGQTSFGYRTCFETIDGSKNVHSNSLFVNVYPNGVRLIPAMYQQLFSLLQQYLPSYQVPPGIRGGDATVRSYHIDDDGNKIPTQIDTDGIIYLSPISTCTDDFKHRFEYFTMPPKRPTSTLSISSKLSTNATTGSCPTTKQYKCIPFDQLTDGNGGYMKVSDGKCLDDYIRSGEKPSTRADIPTGSSPSKELTVAEIEGIVGGITAGVILIGIGFWVAAKLSNSNE